MKSKKNIFLFSTVFFIFFFTNSIIPQSIAFDYGISGAQNYGEPNSTFGFSLIMPFIENIEFVLSYYQWSGEDGNLTLTKKNSTNQNSTVSGNYFGNKGINLLINYKYFSINNISFLLGGGLSQFEMLDLLKNKETDRKYTAAITIVPLYIKMKLSGTIGIYARGTLSAKVNRIIPDWGTLVIGLELKIL